MAADIGATTTGKLEATSRAVDADPLTFPPSFFPSPVVASPIFHPFPFLLFFQADLGKQCKLLTVTSEK